jgi:phospholipase/carboxylesterase
MTRRRAAAPGRPGSTIDHRVERHADLGRLPTRFFLRRPAGRSWWPQSFLAPLPANEPGLSFGLGAVARVMERLQGGGFGPDRIVALGFSQGACLGLEYVARAGRPFHGLVALSGGLLGTGEGDGPARDDLYGHAPKRFDYAGRLDGVTAFLGCHERDPHIPLTRVRETQAVLERLGAKVTAQIYPGGGHGVTEEEVRFLRRLLNQSSLNSGVRS